MRETASGEHANMRMRTCEHANRPTDQVPFSKNGKLPCAQPPTSAGLLIIADSCYTAAARAKANFTRRAHAWSAGSLACLTICRAPSACPKSSHHQLSSARMGGSARTTQVSNTKYRHSAFCHMISMDASDRDHATHTRTRTLASLGSA